MGSVKRIIVGMFEAFLAAVERTVEEAAPHLPGAESGNLLLRTCGLGRLTHLTRLLPPAAPAAFAAAADGAALAPFATLALLAALPALGGPAASPAQLLRPAQAQPPQRGAGAARVGRRGGPPRPAGQLLEPP